MTSDNIEVIADDIFKSECQVLVNPVNTVGIMGAGLAKQFKIRYPNYFSWYVKQCDMKIIETGRVYLYTFANTSIISFPTKQHWKEPSKLEYIDNGLDSLWHLLHSDTKISQDNEWVSIESIALPALGCGLGGLKWQDVKKRIYFHLYGLPIRIEIYRP